LLQNGTVLRDKRLHNGRVGVVAGEKRFIQAQKELVNQVRVEAPGKAVH